MGFKPLKLIIDESLERSVRENFQALSNYLKADPFLKGQFRFVEIPVSAAGTLSYPHGLNFKPSDVITLSVASPDTATVTWKYDQFTRDFIVLNVSAACTVRAYVGSYKE